MKIKRVVAGIYGANCYVVMDEKTKKGFVIDPGGDVDDIEKAIDKMGVEVEYIILTHGHLDHTSGVKELQDIVGGKVCINKKDEDMIKRAADLYGPLLSGNADIYLEEGAVLEVSDMKIKCIETPGHTPGGMCYLVDDTVFTGDTLFFGSIGRSDLEGGDGDLLIKSIKEKLMTLDEDIIVCPGHGPQSSIQREKNSNPFLK